MIFETSAEAGAAIGRPIGTMAARPLRHHPRKSARPKGAIRLPAREKEGGQAVSDPGLAPFAFPAGPSYRPAASLSLGARSVASQVKSGSLRPKWP
jgi:hypothetical protein